MRGEILFSGWDSLLRTLAIGALAYPGMLLLVRLNGHRTLGQLNAFDFIVTVALGSTLASVLVSQDVALAQGLLAFAMLIGYQHLLARAASRSARLERVLNGEPILLACRGQILPDALKSTRITRDEVLASIRSDGLATLEDAEAVILETNGRLSVVHRAEGTPTALQTVHGYSQRGEEQTS